MLIQNIIKLKKIYISNEMSHTILMCFGGGVRGGNLCLKNTGCISALAGEGAGAGAVLFERFRNGLFRNKLLLLLP